MFVLLKVLLFLFRPLVWAIACFLIALLTKKTQRKKLFFRLGLIILIIFSNPLLNRMVLSSYEPAPRQLKKEEVYQAGIVLGGFISYNKKEDKAYFNNASDRFIQTAILYKTGHIQKIIVPAGNGYIVRHNFHESDFIKEQLMKLGIPAGDIYTDPWSRNTLENAINSKRIIDSLHLTGPFLLISSSIHLPRANMVFTRQGVNTTLYPCNFSTKDVGNNFLEDVLLPSAEAMVKWDFFIKEIVGITAYKITGKG